MSFLTGPLILFYTPFFSEWPPVLRRNCLTRCRFSRDRADLARADVVVFHLPNIVPADLPTHRPGQLWTAWSKENEAHYPEHSDPAFRRHFDITMNYRRQSTIWTPYFYSWTPEELTAPPATKIQSAPAAYLQSSGLDRSNRISYVAELMGHMRIDSYGKVLNNRKLDGEDRGRKTKLALISRYKFTLAFENAVDDDYVTEKFFDPLVAGSVPVYFGAPNIADFAPGRNCFIDVREFPSPQALAERLTRLANDEEAYGEYLVWKRQPLLPRFLDMVDKAGGDPMVRLCEYVRRHLPR
jgi:hypothetical protein